METKEQTKELNVEETKVLIANLMENEEVQLFLKVTRGQELYQLALKLEQSLPQPKK